LEPFLNKKYDRIIVSGGDGTVTEVISFMIKNRLKTPLVILPQGSANILAISLKIPLNIKRALMAGLEKSEKTLDAMKINNHYFGMIATGCGYDTLIMQKTKRSLKRKIGAIAYLWTILKTIFIYRSKPYRLYIDGKRTTAVAKTIMAFNISPPLNIRMTKSFSTSQILPDDGVLNIFAFNPHPIRDFMKFNKAVKIFEGKEITIKAKKETKFQIDGTVFKGRSVSIKILPKAINIVC